MIPIPRNLSPSSGGENEESLSTAKRVGPSQEEVRYAIDWMKIHIEKCWIFRQSGISLNYDSQIIKIDGGPWHTYNRSALHTYNRTLTSIVKEYNTRHPHHSRIRKSVKVEAIDERARLAISIRVDFIKPRKDNDVSGVVISEIAKGLDADVRVVRIDRRSGPSLTIKMPDDRLSFVFVKDGSVKVVSSMLNKYDNMHIGSLFSDDPSLFTKRINKLIELYKQPHEQLSKLLLGQIR